MALSQGVHSPETTPSAAGSPHGATGPVIDLQDIKKSYRLGTVTVEALKGITVSIHPGEMVAITGPSGSGKSTLMNVLGCLDRPTSGQYFLQGKRISGLNDDQLARIRSKEIGFVFQTFNLLTRITALENVELPMIYSGSTGDRRAKALAALDRVRLAQRAKHRPTELSGGEQQRVAIARALINDPAIILADEPTGNLDSRVGKEIMGLFHSLNEVHGITLVVVTHDPDVSAQARRVLLIRDGELVSDTRQEPRR